MGGRPPNLSCGVVVVIVFVMVVVLEVMTV